MASPSPASYEIVDGEAVAVEGSGGVRVADDRAARPLEAIYAVDWYRNITYDMFGYPHFSPGDGSAT